VAEFEGIDHVDCRVRSLPAVEPFYDALMPELGLPEKRYSHVDERGDWHAVSAERPHNATEYYESRRSDRAPWFVGFIERRDHAANLTRIAFRVSPARLLELEGRLAAMGARAVERSEKMDEYPAIFFEDPAGTKLELVARLPAP